MDSQISFCLKYFFTYLACILSIFLSPSYFISLSTKKGRLFLLEDLACRIQFKSFLFNFLGSIFKLVLTR